MCDTLNDGSTGQRAHRCITSAAVERRRQQLHSGVNGLAFVHYDQRANVGLSAVKQQVDELTGQICVKQRVDRSAFSHKAALKHINISCCFRPSVRPDVFQGFAMRRRLHDSVSGLRAGRPVSYVSYDFGRYKLSPSVIRLATARRVNVHTVCTTSAAAFLRALTAAVTATVYTGLRLCIVHVSVSSTGQRRAECGEATGPTS